MIYCRFCDDMILIGEDTGLNYGRTVELHCDTGEFYIKSVGKPLKII